ncbi:MAG: transaldolase [Caldilineales bacterium]|nr:transaldolase [Caldilineales bacterium]
MPTLNDFYTEQGQAIWLDFISRDILQSGVLQGLVDQGLRGVTSNPTIFDQAISKSDDYDADIARMSRDDVTPFAVYDTLSQADIQAATDVLRPVFDASGGSDGFVSIEVDPDLAYESARTVAEAKRLWAAIDRPNLMIKVPATPEGVQAIRQLIASGINVNATLMFSLQHYDDVAFAYIEGLEQWVAGGGDASTVNSVASFFVSRIDGVVDKELAARGNGDLQGKIAIANAKLAYARFEEVFSGARWDRLAAVGARVQRPLWASTSTKNPAYPDTLYVDSLLGPHTVNTLPMPTLEAAVEQSVLTRTIDENVEGERVRIDSLASFGIDFNQVTEDLQSAGVASFAKSYHNLLETIAARMKSVRPVA